ncbi:MAG TPA: helix-turn-helix domain-containing protein [Candidatus Lokiarchaeia archaeon]|nr:helix-turn-helix domain-containing protein [Candidatus Lokiarchaeia archaeon]
MERLLTIKNAKELPGMSTLTLQRWDKAGKIQIVRNAGGMRQIPESEIKRFQGTGLNDLFVGFQQIFHRRVFRDSWMDQG